MKIAVVNSVAGISSKELAEFLTEGTHVAKAYKPHNISKFDYTDHDVVFNYGYGGWLGYNKIYNKPEAVRKCVHKPSSFEAFKKAGVNTVEYCTQRNLIPKEWDWVVVRDAVNGRKAEGLAYYENKPGNVPDGQLFSEYYEHDKEYRVVVLCDKVVGFYEKEEDDKGIWHFMIKPKRGFEEMGKQCVAAAKALGIDYVGFDVVAQTKQRFKILEANSAAILTAESMEAIYAEIYR